MFLLFFRKKEPKNFFRPLYISLKCFWFSLFRPASKAGGRPKRELHVNKTRNKDNKDQRISVVQWHCGTLGNFRHNHIPTKID